MTKFNFLSLGVLLAAVILMIPAGISVSAQSESTQSNGNSDVSVFQGTGFVAVLVVTDPGAFTEGGGVAVPVGTNPSDSDITVIPSPTEEGETTTVVTDSNNTVITEIEENNEDNTNVTVVTDGEVVPVDEETQEETTDNVEVIVDNSNEIIDALPTDSESNTDVSNGTNGEVVDNGAVIPDNATVTTDGGVTTVDTGNVTLPIPDNVTQSENVTQEIIDIVDNATNTGGGLGEENATEETPIETVNGTGPIQCITFPCGEEQPTNSTDTVVNGTDTTATPDTTVVDGNETQVEPQVDPIPEPISNNTSSGGAGSEDQVCYEVGNDGAKALSMCIGSVA